MRIIFEIVKNDFDTMSLSDEVLAIPYEGIKICRTAVYFIIIIKNFRRRKRCY